MADLDPPRECNPLCAVARLSGGRGGGMPWVGATLCTFDLASVSSAVSATPDACVSPSRFLC